jgi:DNA-directed RNA polymerase specialized sigma24 family protein
MARDRPPVTRERLERAAAVLSRHERDVLFLSAREGLSYDEIAARLRITPAAVERFLADALCSLDRALEQQERPWWKFW